MTVPRQEMMMRDPFGFGGFGAFGGMPDIFAQVIHCFLFHFSKFVRLNRRKTNICSADRGVYLEFPESSERFIV